MINPSKSGAVRYMTKAMVLDQKYYSKSRSPRTHAYTKDTHNTSNYLYLPGIPACRPGLDMLFLRMICEWGTKNNISKYEVQN
jgi:hypothetical protein